MWTTKSTNHLLRQAISARVGRLESGEKLMTTLRIDKAGKAIVSQICEETDSGIFLASLCGTEA